MGKFDKYKIDLKGIRQDSVEYEYLLDSQFFTDIEGEDIQKGKVETLLTISKIDEFSFSFDFQFNGSIAISCDRCLDDMNFPIDTTSRLVVKLGEDYSEESDDIVTIPEKEGIINIAWFLYEFIALEIPIKHVHAPGKCNKQMAAKLKKHTAKSVDEDDEAFDIDEDVIITDNDTEDTDPRWDELKKLKDNNNLKNK
ncbi:uncharacterized metal-binding protein YceD (DUF177 family) [Dysgonomonadaceae bacterium PH5-43]|nr:uncharacterized metal-binding protein YceD (DUF177 family) [Dysgonomonadaceae bacterium PH5-43]